jgi:metal-dependent amidase/aminoacylase/carboxypeptidase family protein
MDIRKSVDGIWDDIASFRRSILQNPELAWKEFAVSV